MSKHVNSMQDVKMRRLEAKHWVDKGYLSPDQVKSIWEHAKKHRGKNYADMLVNDMRVYYQTGELDEIAEFR